MSCFQANLRRPCFHTSPARKSESGRSISSRLCVSSVRPYEPLKRSVKFATATHRQMPVVKCGQGAIVCLSGSRDKAESGNERLKWNPLEKAIGGFKGQSIEEILRQQIEKQEFAGGGSGKNPPRGNGGGGGGNGSEGAGDEGLSDAIDETIQVTLATLGFIFLYVYIITGEELILLLKDYMKYLSGGGKSNRLQTAMSTWSRFWAGIFREEQKPEKHWLEQEILRTTTWYDSPEKTARYIEESYARRNSDDDDE